MAKGPASCKRKPGLAKRHSESVSTPQQRLKTPLTPSEEIGEKGRVIMSLLSFFENTTSKDPNFDVVLQIVLYLSNEMEILRTQVIGPRPKQCFFDGNLPRGKSYKKRSTRSDFGFHRKGAGQETHSNETRASLNDLSNSAPKPTPENGVQDSSAGVKTPIRAARARSRHSAFEPVNEKCLKRKRDDESMSPKRIKTDESLSLGDVELMEDVTFMQSSSINQANLKCQSWEITSLRKRAHTDLDASDRPFNMKHKPKRLRLLAPLGTSENASTAENVAAEKLQTSISSSESGQNLASSRIVRQPVSPRKIRTRIHGARSSHEAPSVQVAPTHSEDQVFYQDAARSVIRKRTSSNDAIRETKRVRASSPSPSSGQATPMRSQHQIVDGNKAHSTTRKQSSAAESIRKTEQVRASSLGPRSGQAAPAHSQDQVNDRDEAYSVTRKRSFAGGAAREMKRVRASSPIR